MKTLRMLSVAAFVAAAVASQAVTISIVSVGNWTQDTNPPYDVTFSENVLVQNTAPYSALSTLSYTFDVNTLDGVATYTAGNGDKLYLGLASSQAASFAPTVASDHGYWQYLGGTGSYAGLTGGGTYSWSVTLPGQFSQTTVVGELEAVPEPASMAALAMGAAAMIRRRKRA